MVEPMSVETPREVYNYRVYLLAIVSSFGAIIFGYDLAFIGTTLALDSFKKSVFRLFSWCLSVLTVAEPTGTST